MARRPTQDVGSDFIHRSAYSGSYVFFSLTHKAVEAGIHFVSIDCIWQVAAQLSEEWYTRTIEASQEEFRAKGIQYDCIVRSVLVCATYSMYPRTMDLDLT